MNSIKDIIRLVIYQTKLTGNFNSRSTYSLFYIYYVLNKLDHLLRSQLKLKCIPDDIFSFLVMKYGRCNESYIDDNLYILCNSKTVDKSKDWFYLCSKISRKRYKVAVLFTDDVLENNVYISASMKLNISKRLGFENLEEPLIFLYPVQDESVSYATEIKISLISNPYDCTDDLISNLLHNFFIFPRYLRLYDIFGIDVKKYVPEVNYNTADCKMETLYFSVNSLKIDDEKKIIDGSFVIYGKTTLIQEANLNSYVPKKCMCDIPLDTEKQFLSSWPPVLKEPLQQLHACIAPFLQKRISIDVKPVFLIEGPSGSGKSRLIKTAAQSLGLHMVEADFTDVQSLTSAQTEAKLRIILHDAENCVPCLLLLRNIQIFGINSEGQNDERVLAAFGVEVKKLYSKKLTYPIVIIATSNESEIPIDSETTFVEKINIGHLEQNQKCEVLSWLIKSKNLKHQVDLQKIAKMCSDFVLADLEALVLHAIKNRFQRLKDFSKNDFIELTNDDFLHACEYMQSTFSDQIGAPRVPKVHWEDIGGLADLKTEIMRRIEMPLLNVPGLKRSGLLLYGPPGTGKTLLAKAVATECQLHFLSVKGPELLNMYVGQSEKNVRQVFERARAAAPCIIFFDELDSLAPNRGQSGDSGGVMDRVVSQLLAEMDGLESQGSVFIIAATNRPDLIDPALLRPGRFDKMLYVGIYSDTESQMGVLKALTRHFRLARGGKELEELVKELPDNLTGADLYSVCSNAWLRAVRRALTSQGSEKEKEEVKGEDVVVGLEDFVHTSRDLVPSVSREEIIRYEKLREELSTR
ncbi:peroxisome assembly factor 2 [Nasonia vitripennis]|uniref:Peroxisomal ATPase PEX6 n=1 Tax=Nasonia vitripennis TaxID=7425 RepID=A0A7M7Q8H8_NASVI|nr:peroxisome assembly factor 2 [Nasonia vitripennis]XP_031782514.1 peroxisome assembly factor 2 [Nasonia vitripennis]